MESRYDAKFCQPEGSVVSRVEGFRQVPLDANAAKAEKQRALRFLARFLQGQHQPVQVDDNGDPGGNPLQLRFPDVATDLHRLLDTQIIDRHSQAEAQRVRELGVHAMRPQVAGLR
jgi:hypothetical protein